MVAWCDILLPRTMKFKAQLLGLWCWTILRAPQCTIGPSECGPKPNDGGAPEPGVTS